MNFRYRTVYEKGKPVHGKLDLFSIKHPPMELSRRAKIFSPFDALKGFDEAIARKEAESNKGTDTTDISDISDVSDITEFSDITGITDFEDDVGYADDPAV